MQHGRGSKRELGHYSIVVTSATTLELREENEYLWQLKSSRCTAKVRIVQRLERASGAAATPPPEAVPTSEPACVPGPPTRIKLRPRTPRSSQASASVSACAGSTRKAARVSSMPRTRSGRSRKRPDCAAP